MTSLHQESMTTRTTNKRQDTGGGSVTNSSACRKTSCGASQMLPNGLPRDSKQPTLRRTWLSRRRHPQQQRTVQPSPLCPPWWQTVPRRLRHGRFRFLLWFISALRERVKTLISEFWRSSYYKFQNDVVTAATPTCLVPAVDAQVSIKYTIIKVYPKLQSYF